MHHPTTRRCTVCIVTCGIVGWSTEVCDVTRVEEIEVKWRLTLSPTVHCTQRHSSCIHSRLPDRWHHRPITPRVEPVEQTQYVIHGGAKADSTVWLFEALGSTRWAWRTPRRSGRQFVNITLNLKEHISNEVCYCLFFIFVRTFTRHA